MNCQFFLHFNGGFLNGHKPILIVHTRLISIALYMTDRISKHVNGVSQQPGQSPKFSVVQDPKSTLCGWIAIIYGLQIRTGEALQLLEQFSQIVLDQKEKLYRQQKVITRVDNISGGNYFVVK
ncbi:Hypothetical_protein [Hexamita inflata]|uniref:Hypothetical_protein n=1 Tax=Hexamita inflata TaxID=28002 RepID=A0AA86RMK3_9EUKA|nr:Hypothetical protein HINF_LOCUS63983 [Hexamita inflata]